MHRYVVMMANGSLVIKNVHFSCIQREEMTCESLPAPLEFNSRVLQSGTGEKSFLVIQQDEFKQVK